MTAAEMVERTYLPSEETGLAEVYSFLDAHERSRGTGVLPRCLLVGEHEGDQVELPASMYQLLLQVVEAMRAGRAVTVAPHSTTLTTQQAADLLGVSRPTVVRLIDAGELPAERPGTRRQVFLRDVLEYREKRRQRQYEMLAATAIDIDDEDDPADVAAQLREVRKTVAGRRRA
ncbi:helix-turn-helix domain-containing protein [Ruania zhangjianzhongii]|uniref:helix-turn-helix domain-containing protein n=1 Tax=Ruania zhangjianzhongii TaxID=2603206 RepID=UPI0011D270D3|nr:helix-turn-helix domain-containing protein [Ruania zhangjianzhongii]